MRRLYIGGLAFVLGVASCVQIFNIDAAETGWAGGTGAMGNTSGSGSTTTGPTSCTPGDMTPCYDGGADTEGVGSCVGGMTTCNALGTAYGACVGEVTPAPATCAGTADVACLGHDNCVHWATGIGNDMGSYARGVAVDASGNSFVIGTFSGVIQIPGQAQPLTAMGMMDTFLIKYGADGTPAWGQSFGAAGAQTQVLAVGVDPQGRVAIGGSAFAAVNFGTFSAGPGAFVTKLDGTGTVLWAQGLTLSYAAPFNDGVQALACAANGDVVVGGVFSSDLSFGDSTISGPGTSGASYGFVGRLLAADGSGKMGAGGWGRGIGSGASGCSVTGLAVVPQGTTKDDILVAGNFSGTVNLSPTDPMSAAGAQDAFVGALTATGDSLWHKDIGGSGAMANASGLAAAADGGPVLTGAFTGDIEFAPGEPATGSGSFVVHYDGSGGYGWNQILTDAPTLSVAADSAGNTVLAGAFSGPLSFPGGSTPLMPTGSTSLFVAKLSSAPALLWAKSYGDGTSQPTASGVSVTSQGGPVIAGDIVGVIKFGDISVTPLGQHSAFVVGLSP